MKYTVWIVAPKGYEHWRSFNDIAYPLRDAFRELGHECAVVTDVSKCVGTTIVLAGHLLQEGDALPDDMIIYNLEQVGSSWMDGYYLELMQKHTVWDYSRVNVAALMRFGIRAKLLEVGYMPRMKYNVEAKQDIEVLFLGSMNERRQRILEACAEHCEVTAGFGLYGKERDALVARAKVVINLHFYPAKIFEITRCGPLMANAKCIVSETGTDEMAEQPYRSGIAFVSYHEIVDKCIELLKNDDERKSLGLRGHELFAARRYTDFLREVL